MSVPWPLERKPSPVSLRRMGIQTVAVASTFDLSFAFVTHRPAENDADIVAPKPDPRQPSLDDLAKLSIQHVAQAHDAMIFPGESSGVQCEVPCREIDSKMPQSILQRVPFLNRGRTVFR
jgi:hypothetical protein